MHIRNVTFYTLRDVTTQPTTPQVLDYFVSVKESIVSGIADADARLKTLESHTLFDFDSEDGVGEAEALLLDQLCIQVRDAWY
eukprot:3540757-Rhodomonas_salina.2